MSEIDWLDDDDERGLESTAMTNADKIRSMTDEQLADLLAEVTDCWHCPTYQECTDVKSCDNALLAWLKREHKSNSTLTQL